MGLRGAVIMKLLGELLKKYAEEGYKRGYSDGDRGLPYRPDPFVEEAMKGFKEGMKKAGMQI